MRVFQKRRLSGNPSRSRGPGSSSRKKSASWASKERSPLGTIRTGWLSEGGVAGGLTSGVSDAGGEERLAAPRLERSARLSSSVDCVKKWRRSSARSRAAEKRSDARLESALRQM